MRVLINHKLMGSTMKAKKLTDPELSKLTGISRPTICYVRNGKTCSVDTALKIAQELQLDLDKFVLERRE